MSKLKSITVSNEVLAAINGELHYQSTLQAAGRADNVDYGVAGQVVCLEHYTREVSERWCNEKGDEGALDSMRKVAAIAIRALIEHGCPVRVIKEPKWVPFGGVIHDDPDDIAKKGGGAAYED